MGFSRQTSTGVGCHFLLQGIFLTQGLNCVSYVYLYWQVDSLPLAPPGKPLDTNRYFISVCFRNRWVKLCIGKNIWILLQMWGKTVRMCVCMCVQWRDGGERQQKGSYGIWEEVGSSVCLRITACKSEGEYHWWLLPSNWGCGGNLKVTQWEGWLRWEHTSVHCKKNPPPSFGGSSSIYSFPSLLAKDLVYFSGSKIIREITWARGGSQGHGDVKAFFLHLPAFLTVKLWIESGFKNSYNN